jgi:hypothetical protein
MIAGFLQYIITYRLSGRQTSGSKNKEAKQKAAAERLAVADVLS